MKKGKTPKTITLSEEALTYAQNIADSLFGGNLSAYVNYTIMKEKNNVNTINITKVEQPVEAVSTTPMISEEKRNTLNMFVGEEE